MYKYANDGDLIPGVTFTWQVRVSNSSAVSTWTPKIVDLLPAQAEYVADSFALDKSSSDSVCPNDFTESIGKPTASAWSDRQQVAWTSATFVTAYAYGHFNVVDHTALWIEKQSSGNLNAGSGSRE